MHEPEVGALLAEADMLLVLGSSFDGMNTKNWRIDLPARRAAVTARFGVAPPTSETVTVTDGGSSTRSPAVSGIRPRATRIRPATVV